MTNAYSKFFSVDMSSFEAQSVLFSKADGLSKNERDELFAAYKEVLPAILKRENKENRGYCTSV